MKNRALFVLVSGLLLLATEAFGQSYSQKLQIDVSCYDPTPANPCPAGVAPGQVAAQTAAKGINARGDIVGSYVGSDGITHGFILNDGLNAILAGAPLHFTSIDFPALQTVDSNGVPTVVAVRGTSVSGINSQGEIVGTYTLPVNHDPNSDPAHNPTADLSLYCPADLKTGPDPACSKSFYYSRGNFIKVAFPDHPGATVQSITADGAIYGCIHDHDTGMSMYGAAWQRYNTKGGEQLVAPAFNLTAGGGQLVPAEENEMFGNLPAVPMSMNNGSTGGAQIILGFYVDMNNRTRGYLVHSGILQPYDASPNASLTAIWGVNPSGQFVGTYRLTGEVKASRHGFVQSAPAADGSLPAAGTVDWPGAFVTIVNAINPEGVVVGQYALPVTLSDGTTVAGPLHGFLALPKSTTD